MRLLPPTCSGIACRACYTCFIPLTTCITTTHSLTTVSVSGGSSVILQSGGEEVMRPPTTEVIDRLMQINAEFWGREFSKSSGSGKRLADEVLVYPGIRGKRMIELVQRIIVPAVALERATYILKGLPSC